MRIHYFQHAPFETPDRILDWAKARGHTLSATRFFAGESLPDLQQVDMLVIMGGPMSVNDETQHPWLADEKRFIHDAVESGKSVLGICLGAQLLASALGAKVYANPQKEIGWFPVKLSPSGVKSRVFAGFPVEFSAFQWHGDTFDLPQGAQLLASSDVCRNQAFQYGEHAFGIQFHLEVSPEGVKGFVEHCGDELVDGPTIQSVEQMLQSDEYEPSRQRLFEFLDKIS